MVAEPVVVLATVTAMMVVPACARGPPGPEQPTSLLFCSPRSRPPTVPRPSCLSRSRSDRQNSTLAFNPLKEQPHEHVALAVRHVRHCPGITSVRRGDPTLESFRFGASYRPRTSAAGALNRRAAER